MVVFDRLPIGTPGGTIAPHVHASNSSALVLYGFGLMAGLHAFTPPAAQLKLKGHGVALVESGVDPS